MSEQVIGVELEKEQNIDCYWCHGNPPCPVEQDISEQEHGDGMRRDGKGHTGQGSPYRENQPCSCV